MILRRPTMARRGRSIDDEASVASDTSSSLGVMMQIPPAFLRPSSSSSSSPPPSTLLSSGAITRRPFHAGATNADTTTPPSNSRCIREEGKIDRLVVMAKAQQQRTLQQLQPSFLSSSPFVTGNPIRPSRPPIYHLQQSTTARGITTITNTASTGVETKVTPPRLRKIIHNQLPSPRSRNFRISTTGTFDKEIPPPSTSSSRSFKPSGGFLTRRMFLSSAASGSFMDAIHKDSVDPSCRTVLTTASSSPSQSAGDPNGSPKSMSSSASSPSSHFKSPSVVVQDRSVWNTSTHHPPTRRPVDLSLFEDPTTNQEASPSSSSKRRGWKWVKKLTPSTKMEHPPQHPHQGTLRI